LVPVNESKDEEEWKNWCGKRCFGKDHNKVVGPVVKIASKKSEA